MTRQRGGVLLDLFLIAALIAGGLAGWTAWRKGSLPSMLRDVISAPVTLGVKETPSEPDLDVSDRSMWIQSQTRDLLAKMGAGDKHVVKTYNAERQEDGIQWLEDTLVVRRPSGFKDAEFLKGLAPLLAERRLVLMEDRSEESRRTLEVGDRKRVYQRIVFEGTRTPGRPVR